MPVHDHAHCCSVFVVCLFSPAWSACRNCLHKHPCVPTCLFMYIILCFIHQYIAAKPPVTLFDLQYTSAQPLVQPCILGNFPAIEAGKSCALDPCMSLRACFLSSPTALHPYASIRTHTHTPVTFTNHSYPPFLTMFAFAHFLLC